ncbi:MAG TPA: hypothetical protein VFN37_07125 [Candidatus Baltobacteraceae bacterium]|nr:hypothetical protein [Candidatus Baltobacteraceae bacterium]
MMRDEKAALANFIEQCARRDGARAVPESEVRGAIRGYVKCLGIAYRGRRELTPAQLDRAVRHYHKRRAELHRQPPLLAA